MGRPDFARSVEETLAALAVSRDGDGWSGVMPANMWGPIVFGGFVVAHAISAATGDAPPGSRMHSLHAYFLRPVRGGLPIAYRVDALRDGRTITTRRVEAEQDGKHVFSMTCSFAIDGDGYEYQLPMPDGLPDPETVTTERVGPWTIASLGGTEPQADGTRRSTHRMWFRIDEPLPDDPHLHTALLGFASDITFTGARPLHLDGDTRGIVSIDHAVWFHQPLRADEWAFYDVHSLVNAGGRGALRGTVHSRDGRLCVSVVQETVLIRYEDAPAPSH